MRFHPTKLPGVVVVEPEPHVDARGLFARTFSVEEFRDHGLTAQWSLCATSFNQRKGTLRGMHFQVAPFAESKLVRCSSGRIWDVALDLRPGSRTYLQWYACELSSGGRTALYLPAGVAHGFQTLTDEAEVFYQIDGVYSPAHGRGVRWNDPAFGIDWPLQAPVLSERDASYPDFVDGQL